MPRGASDRPSMENQREPNYIMNEDYDAPMNRTDNLTRYVESNLSQIPNPRFREYR